MINLFWGERVEDIRDSLIFIFGLFEGERVFLVEIGKLRGRFVMGIR